MRIVQAEMSYAKKGVPAAVELEKEDIEIFKDKMQIIGENPEPIKQEIRKFLSFARKSGLLDSRHRNIVFQATDGIQWDVAPNVPKVMELLPCVI